MKPTLVMIGLGWLLVAVCLTIAVMGMGGGMDTWMKWILGGVTLYVLGLAIELTRERLHGHSFRFREDGHFHWPGHGHAHGHGKIPH